MKRSMVFVSSAIALAAALLGCASKQPTRELVDARAAYARAQAGPAPQVNPAGLYEARKSLEAAERKQNDDPGSAEAKNLAYVAERRIERAEANARTITAEQQEMQAKQTLEQMRAQQLATAQGQLQTEQQRVASERAARQEADRRAKEAIDRLSNVALIKNDTRGTVITLTGSVLFASNKSDILPAARGRLNQVADALKQVDRPVTVIGFTDSKGNPEHNMALSQKRAESVRTYLIERGVPADRLLVEGRGEADPIASNATPDGRANNRRVEIVVPGGEGGGGMAPEGTMPESSGTRGGKTGGTKDKGGTHQGGTKQTAPPSGTSTPQH